jgi:hypothetical protein
MVWRKWIVRGIVWGIIGACGAGALAYQRWTNSAAVREQIIAKLSETFPGAEVSVDSARLQILGGFRVNGLRLSRKDDPEKHEFLQVPSAIFYHDKEKILDGELTLRKIELIRPRLIARRRRDGTWNLQDLLRPPGDKPKAAMPAIVIHQGTLILVDQLDPAKTAVLEINDVGMTIINDPLPKVTIRGAASSELLGRLQLHGTLDRDRDEAFLSFKATQIALTQALLARLPAPGPANLLDGLKLSATANLEGRLWYHPTQAQPLYYDVRCEVSNGKVEHPDLPLPLEKLYAKLHCNDGTLELETLTARSGKTQVEAHGKAQLPRADKEFEVHVELKHVMLGEPLAAKLPAKIGDLHRKFQPDGPTSIHIACAQHEGQWVTLTSGKPSQVSLRPENISLKFKDFPYPLERTTGSVDYNLLDKRVDIDLKAHASDQPVILRGHWTGEEANADVDFNILADDIPINGTLLAALKTDGLMVLHNFSERFHATGKVNVVAKIKHEPGHKYTNIFKLHFHETAICWDDFPYPLTNVSGTLEIYPDHWAIRQFQGTHKSGHILVNGRSTPKDEKGESHGIKLEITGRNVTLNDDLREALRPMKGLYDAWFTFRPQGNLFFTATVDRPSSDPRELKVKVNAQRACVKPAFFPYLIQDIAGDFWFHNNRLTIRNLHAKHAQTLIQVDNGEVDLNARGAGGYYADFADLQVVGFQLDNDFIQAVPSEKLRKAAQTIQLSCLPDSPPVRFLTRLVIKQAPETGKPPEVFWDGRLWVNNARIGTGIEFSKVTGEIACRGLTNGPQLVGLQGNALIEQALLYNQPFKKAVDLKNSKVDYVHASFVMLEKTPDVLKVDLHAPIFSGDVTGQVEVHFNSTLTYTVNLTASKINLAEFGLHNLGPKSQLSGVAAGRLVLSGWGTSADTIEGNGELNIPSRAHIYNLPFLLEFLNSLGLNGNHRTTFEEFHTTFDIQSTKVHLKKVDLLGNTLSLAGKGDFDLLSKDLKLDVYPMWGRVEQLFPKEIQQVPRVFSKNLLMVEVRGKVSSETKDLKFHIKPLPIVLGPVLSIRDLINSKGTGGSDPTPEPRNPDPILDVPARTRIEKN